MIPEIKEFKPALLFLGKFLALYLAGNVSYGLYIEACRPRPDAVTHLVAAQASNVLEVLAYDASFGNVAGAPKVAMREGGIDILYVFEGCNGVNVMIVFIAFLFAFGGSFKALSVFVPAGLLIIHCINLLRIGQLYRLALGNSSQFYYYHKYVFTAILYVAVIGLWALWVMKVHEKRDVKADR